MRQKLLVASVGIGNIVCGGCSSNNNVWRSIHCLWGCDSIIRIYRDIGGCYGSEYILRVFHILMEVYYPSELCRIIGLQIIKVMRLVGFVRSE